MGMFDYIECQYPLPDGFVPAVGELAQSKDTDSQYLDVYQMLSQLLLSLPFRPLPLAFLPT